MKLEPVPLQPADARDRVATAVGIPDELVPAQAVQALCKRPWCAARLAIHQLPSAPKGLAGPALDSWVVLSVNEAIRLEEKLAARLRKMNGVDEG